MLPQVRLDSRLNVHGDVWGVAELNNEIYVVCSQSPIVRVFAADPPNNRLKDFKVEGLQRPRDLTADSLTQQLYIADILDSRCVWRIAAADHTVDKFITDVRPRSLSVTSGRLLVMSWSDELLLYGADGVRLHQIALQKNMLARHAVETPRGTYIVCHTDWQADRHHGVSEMDGTGRAVRVYYDGPPGPDPLQLNWPYRVAQFAAGRRLLIADSGNSRVLSLAADLKLHRVLLTADHDQLDHQTWRLRVNAKTQRLVVNEYQSPRAIVYRIMCSM